MYEVVLLQVSTAKGNVSGHLQQLLQCERGILALETAQLNLVYDTNICVDTQTEKGVVYTYSPRSVLSQEGLHVTSSHQLQQDEARQDVQADADAAYNVLMAELAM